MEIKHKMSYSFFKEIEFHKEYMKELLKKGQQDTYEYQRYFYLEDFCRIFRLDYTTPKSLPYIDEIQNILKTQFNGQKFIN